MQFEFARKGGDSRVDGPIKGWRGRQGSCELVKHHANAHEEPPYFGLDVEQPSRAAEAFGSHLGGHSDVGVERIAVWVRSGYNTVGMGCAGATRSWAKGLWLTQRSNATLRVATYCDDRMSEHSKSDLQAVLLEKKVNVWSSTRWLTQLRVTPCA